MRSYSVSVNGKVFQVEVQENQSDMATKKAPVAAVAPVSAPIAASAQKAAPASAPPKAAAAPTPVAAPAAGSGTVEAPMPGKILAINVTQGQAVSQNQALCVLEAMKMENDICSPIAGTVTGIHVAAGDAVDTGKLLFTIG